MKALCIYNPNAGSGKALKQLPEIMRLFKKYGIHADILLTQYAHHGTKLIKDADLSSFDALIVAGGDGSFFDVLNAFMHKNQPLPIGLIPVGTGNSLSKDIASSAESMEKFVKIITDGHLKAFDIGKVSGQNKTFYFANMTGFGFTTDVTLTGIKYKFLGDFAYTLGVILNTIKLKSFPLQMHIKGNIYDMQNTFVAVSNSRYAGGKMLVAPKAKVDDGLLDIIVVNKVSRWQLLKTFPKIFDGSYINSPFVEYYQASEVSFTTSLQKMLSPDGEIMEALPVKISILPRVINLFIEEMML